MLNTPAYQDALLTVNVSFDDLMQVNILVSQMVANKDLQTQMHSDVRLALQQRNLQFERSKRWFAMLMSTARIAFQNQPGLLAAMLPASVRTEAEGKATRALRAAHKAAQTMATASGTAQLL